MKKNLFFFILGLLLCGCQDRPVEKAQINVDSSPIYMVVGETKPLPVASSTYQDKNMNEYIVLEVSDDNTVVYKGVGSKVNNFTPTYEGLFTVSYKTILNEQQISDTVAINLYVSSSASFGDVKSAKITVEKSNDNFDNLHPIYTRAATAKNHAGQDVSEHLKVRVLNSKNEVIFEGRGNERNEIDANQGTFTVVYSLDIEGVVFEEKSYFLVVAKYENAIPTIEVPRKTLEINLGESISIPRVKAIDAEDGDISNLTKYAVYKNDSLVLNEKLVGLNEKFTPNEVGEYEVLFSATDKDNLTSEKKGFKVNVLPTSKTILTVDGDISEESYLKIPTYITGLSNEVKSRFATSEEGLFVSFKVTDKNVIVNSENSETGFNTSDGVDISVDAICSGALKLTSLPIVRVRVRADGAYKVYRSNNSTDQWNYYDYSLEGKVVSLIKGTKTNYGDGISQNGKDFDEGYVVEMMLPWALLGANSYETINQNMEKINICVGHRNVLNPSIKCDYVQAGNANNLYFNGCQSNGRPKVVVEALNPSQYATLYLNGSKLGVNPVEYGDVTLDGIMEGSFWKDAQEILCPLSSLKGTIKAYTKADLNGIYVAGSISDSQIVSSEAQISGKLGIMSNDSFDIRVVTGDEMNRTGLVPSDQRVSNSKIVIVDSSSFSVIQMLNQANTNKNTAHVPYKIGVNVDGTNGTCKNHDKFDENDVYIADENVNDVDNWWGFELFIPYSSLNMSKPNKGDTIKYKVLVANYDRGTSVSGATWIYSYKAVGVNVSSGSTNPSTYLTIEYTI